MSKTIKRGADLGPLRVQEVHGEPYVVGERRLIPVARIVSLGRARAMVGVEQTGGWAGGFSWIKPVAVVVETPHGTQRIRIEDATKRAVKSMAMPALCLAIVLAVVRHLVRR